MGQPVTTNPWMIALINMTVVFGVLYFLSLIIAFIQFIDPTKKKASKVENNVVTTEPAPVASVQDDMQIIAVIAAAISAYGYSPAQIACIRRKDGQAWAQAARVEAVTVRNQMF